MYLLGWTVLLIANHGFAYANLKDGRGYPQWKVDEITAFVEARCPAEWARFADIEPVGLGVPVTEPSAENEFYLRLVWRDWKRVFGDQHDHFHAFVRIGASQVATYLAYQDYLKTGTVEYLDGDADELRRAFATKTALLECVWPQDQEVSWPPYDRFWPRILDPLECRRWMRMSADVLALDVAAAGTTASNDLLTAVLENTIGQCEKDETP